MANDRGIRGEGDSSGRSGLGAATPLAPPPGLWARPRRPPPCAQQVCAPEGGSPPSARPPGARGPDSPAAAAALSCAGRGAPSPPGAGRRLWAPGRRLPGRRAPSRAVAGSSGAAAGACEPVGRPGAASRAHRPTRPPLPLRSCLRLPPGLRRSLPAGPVSGPSAEDPPPGAALRLLRRRRLRRRQLLPASRPPGRPRGARGLSPARESRRAGGEETRGSIPGCPDPGWDSRPARRTTRA